MLLPGPSSSYAVVGGRHVTDGSNPGFIDIGYSSTMADLPGFEVVIRRSSGTCSTRSEFATAVTPRGRTYCYPMSEPPCLVLLYFFDASLQYTLLSTFDGACDASKQSVKVKDLSIVVGGMS